MLRILTEMPPEDVGKALRTLFGEVEEREKYYIVHHRRPQSSTYVRVEATEAGTEVEVDHEYSLLWFSKIVVVAYGVCIALSISLKSRMGILITMLAALASYAIIYTIYGRREERVKAAIREALRGRVLEE